MNLLAKDSRGRLDPMAACRLLWSGALSFEREAVMWDGETHQFGQPTIHGDVISLYAVPRREVDEVVPDILHMLVTLESDEHLRVPASQIASGVREALPEGDLTGAALFLLQAATHPLIIEAPDTSSVGIRYDERLARGIPHLCELLCRLACQLRFLRGDTGEFTVRFAECAAAVGSSSMDDFEGCVEHATGRLPASVEVAKAEFEDAARSCAAAWELAAQATEPDAIEDPDLRYLRVVGAAETEAFAIHELLCATKERIERLGRERTRLEESKPNPNDKQYKTAAMSSLKLPTGERAARSLAMRSAVYIAIGALVFYAGTRCVNDREAIARWVVSMLDRVVAIALDAVNLFAGHADLMGSIGAGQIPTDGLAGFLRVAGVVIMTIGVVWPVRRILRHKRRLDHELAHTNAHVGFMAALIEKNKQGAETALALATEAWATGIERVASDERLAGESLARLEETDELARQCVEACYETGVLPSEATGLCAVCTMADYLDSGAADTIAGDRNAIDHLRRDLAQSRVSADPRQVTSLQPTARTAVRHADMLVRRVSAEPSEEGRRRLTFEHCDEAAALFKRTKAELAALRALLGDENCNGGPHFHATRRPNHSHSQ